ncbi:hypothetical protein [Bacillus toyonensis]|uniref:hypothetical protein n=1 Tax=Bacillus toyonensis TaxID=155322 RepID=UPI001C0CA35F|nr:hypothetical protein [Bacillus toyonensis]MBU4643080.1 hypothetical protein [Bacillus toyonensis]
MLNNRIKSIFEAVESKINLSEHPTNCPINPLDDCGSWPYYQNERKRRTEMNGKLITKN